MNQGRIWCVVHPTVGLPLFLGSVALTSLAVHTAIMTHTNWMSSYWAGSTRAKVAMETNPVTVPAQPGSAFSMTVTPAPAADGTAQTAFVITVAPATVQATKVAAADPAAGDPAGSGAILATNAK